MIATNVFDTLREIIETTGYEYYLTVANDILDFADFFQDSHGNLCFGDWGNVKIPFQSY